MGRPDWWWVGRNFPRIFPKSWTDRWELMVPVFRTLIAARNATFFDDFRRSGKGPDCGSPSLVAEWSQFSQDLPEITDRSLGFNGA